MAASNKKRILEMTKRYLTIEELEARVRNLTPVELLRLKGIARTFTGNHELDADDLLQEAIFRVFTGCRKKCAEDFPIVNYIAGIMKSITYDNRQSYKRVVHDNVNDKISAEDNAETPEDSIAAQDLVKELESLFEDDEEILLLIFHISEGATPGEIKQEEKWSDTKYNSIRRRLRRNWNTYRRGIS